MKRKNQLNPQNPRDAKVLLAREEQKAQLSTNRSRINRTRIDPGKEKEELKPGFSENNQQNT